VRCQHRAEGSASCACCGELVHWRSPWLQGRPETRRPRGFLPALETPKLFKAQHHPGSQQRSCWCCPLPGWGPACAVWHHGSATAHASHTRPAPGLLTVPPPAPPAALFHSWQPAIRQRAGHPSKVCGSMPCRGGPSGRLLKGSIQAQPEYCQDERRGQRRRAEGAATAAAGLPLARAWDGRTSPQRLPLAVRCERRVGWGQRAAQGAEANAGGLHLPAPRPYLAIRNQKVVGAHQLLGRQPWAASRRRAASTRRHAWLHSLSSRNDQRRPE